MSRGTVILDRWLNNRERLAYTLLLPALLIVSLTLLIPTLFNAWASTQKWSLVRGEPEFVGGDNYVALLDPAWSSILIRTVVFVILVVAAQLLIGATLAWLLYRRFGRLGPLRTLFLVPMMMSEVTAALGWRLLMVGENSFVNWLLGLVGIPPQVFLGGDWAFTTIIIVEVWIHTSFVTLLLYAGLLGMPRSPLEAAAIDGASGFRLIWSVVIPLLRPVILIVLLFRTIFSLRAFGTIYVLTQGGPAGRTTVLGFEIYQQGFQLYDIGRSSTMSIVLMLLSIGISLLYVRFVSRESLS